MENLKSNELGNAEEIDDVSTEKTSPPEKFAPLTFAITGKGHHLKMSFIHLISIALMWFLLRITIFTMSVEAIQKHPVMFWSVSVIVAVCIHMAAFGRMFQSFAEIGQIMQILKQHCEGTKNELWEKISVLQDKGTVDAKVSGRLSKITLDFNVEKSETSLVIH